MSRIIVIGLGPDSGKTIVSAILVKAFQGEYWKAVQCCHPSDTEIVTKLVNDRALKCHDPVYLFKHRVSPHIAADLENITIDPSKLHPPKTKGPLIIEGTGGLLVPLRDDLLWLDQFAALEAKWILVSRHVLGSINQTLLTLEALKKRNIRLSGMVINGEENPCESVILRHAAVPFHVRLKPEAEISSSTIHQYAESWKPHLQTLTR